MSMGASGARSRKAAAGSDADKAALRSELRRLEKELAELRASEKMYRVSAGIAGRLIWRADPEGRLVDFSRVFSPLTGISVGRLIAGGWIEAIHPDDREYFLEQWNHSLRTGEEFAVEFRSLRADGAVRVALARAVADRDAEGEIKCWYGITEDIHDEYEAERARREAEARLRESEELHRFTLELTQI